MNPPHPASSEIRGPGRLLRAPAPFDPPGEGAIPGAWAAYAWLAAACAVAAALALGALWCAAAAVATLLGLLARLAG